MCTVTIIPVGGRGRTPAAAPPRAAPDVPFMRLACNRDELRTRALAEPPVVRSFGQRQAILPLDPASGGTWIAVNDAGLAATLLNVNPAAAGQRPAAPVLRSRGRLVPHFMALATIDQAATAAGAINPREYPPFRLVLADIRTVVDARSDGRTLRIEHHDLSERALFFTSSGLGDALVEGPRRALFDEMFAPEADWVAQQPRFHRHVWPDRRPLSVCMERPDARTVSHTVVDVEPERVTLTYWPDAPDQTDPLPALLLARSRVGP